MMRFALPLAAIVASGFMFTAAQAAPAGSALKVQAGNGLVQSVAMRCKRVCSFRKGHRHCKMVCRRGHRHHHHH